MEMQEENQNLSDRMKKVWQASIPKNRKSYQSDAQESSYRPCQLPEGTSSTLYQLLPR